MSYLKYNRPDSSDLTIAKADGTEFHVKASAEDAAHWWTMLNFRANEVTVDNGDGTTTTSGEDTISYFKNVSGGKSITTLAETDTTAQWTDIKIVIDEGTKKFSVNATTEDGQEYSVSNGWFTANAYEINNSNIADGTSLSDYDSLDNLTLYLRNYAQTLYVDSFKVYEISPTYTDAVILGGSSVKYDEAAQIKFVNTASDEDKTTDATISSVPEGAVTITDESGNSLAVTQEYDSAEQILSVKPEDGFTIGETYTIAFNETVLNNNGIITTGTESFTVRARDDYDTGIVLDDNFATGTDNWVVGTSSATDYEATITPVDAEGAVDGKALMITFPAEGSGNSAYGSVTKLLGNGIEFSPKETLTVKARVKADTAMKYQIKANRPNTLTQPPNDDVWRFYNALLIHEESGALQVLGGSLYSDAIGGTVYNYRANTDIATNDDTGLWTEYTIVFKPAEEKYYVTVVTTDAEGNETTVASNKAGYMLATRSELETEFGVGYFKADDGQYYLDLSRLTFTSRTAGNLYVDYVKAYTEKEYIAHDVTAYLTEGILLDKTDAVKVTFVSDDDIASIPEGAVAITGVEATESYDAATKTLTLTPETALTAGTEYTVTVDADALDDECIDYTGAETLTFNTIGYGKNYWINDDFNTTGDIGNWKFSEVSSDSTRVVTLEQTTDGTDGVLKFTTTANDFTSKATPTIYNDFDDIKLGDYKLVLETRVKTTGGTNKSGEAGNWVDLTINRPTQTKYLGTVEGLSVLAEDGETAYAAKVNLHGWAGGTVARIDADSINYKSTSATYSTKDLAENMGTNEWVNIKMVFSNNSSYEMTVWEDGKEDEAITKVNTSSEYACLWENNKGMYDIEGLIDAQTAGTLDSYVVKGRHEYLKRLAFVPYKFSNEISIDYFRLYAEIEPTDTISAKLENTHLDEADAVKVQLTASTALTELPEGIFAIDGVEATESFDATTQVLTLTPAETLTEGTTYTINVDTDALANLGYKYTTTKALTFSILTLGANEIFHDTFDTEDDLGGWVLGVMNVSNNSTQTLVQETLADGTGVMKLTGSATSRQSFYQPNAFRDFDDIVFADGESILLETRFKVVGGGVDPSGTAGSKASLLFNRPNDLTILENTGSFNYLGWNCGILGYSNDSGFGHRPSGYSIENLSADMGAGTWVNVKYLIDGAAGTQGTYTVTAWTDGNEANAVSATGTLKEYRTQFYDVYGYAANGSTEATRHDSFDSLTWAFDNYSNEVLVDYVKLTKIIECKAYATLDGGSTVKYDEPVKLTFKATDAEITSIPAGAVTISGVETTQSFDAETGVLSVIPSTPLTVGNIYTVAVDTYTLAEAGIDYTGSTSFTVRARDDYDTGVVIDDNFATGADNWAVGQSASGYEAAVTAVDAEGAVDGKALKITFPAAGTSQGSYYGSVIKLLGDGVKFSTEETLILKARVKADNGMSYQIKANRPDTLEQFKNDYTWTHYHMLASYESTGIFYALNNSLYENIGEAPYSYRGTNEIAAQDVAGLWTEYTIVFDPANEKYYVTIVTTDAEGNETTIASNKTGYMLSTKYELDKEFGIGYFKVDDGQYFIDLSSLTFTARTAGNLYVDYVKVYEQADGKIYNQSGATAIYNAPLKFTLDSSKPISAISEDAITIDGVETTLAYDAATQVITLTPENNLTIGDTYKVTIDKDVLLGDGINYTGVASFNIRARDARETGVVISDDFNDGTTEGWTIGAANDGYEAGLDVVDVDGEEGNKALKVTMSAIATGDGNQPNVTRILGNGIEFKDDEWVTITTRIKRNEGFNYFLKANRPDEISQVLHEYEWAAYALMAVDSKVHTVTSTGALGGVDGAYTYYPADPNGADIPTDWVTYTITFKPETGCYWISATLDDGTVLTNERVGAIYVAGTAIEKMFGTTPVSKSSYNFLDSLTFVPMAGNTGELLIDYIDVKVVNTNFIGMAQLMVDDKEVTEITPNTTVKPVFTINPEDGVTEYTVISALYIDGILEDTHINPVAVTENGYVYTEADGWVIPSALEGKYEIKAFVWDTLGGMKPVSDVAKIESTAND